MDWRVVGLLVCCFLIGMSLGTMRGKPWRMLFVFPTVSLVVSYLFHGLQIRFAGFEGVTLSVLFFALALMVSGAGIGSGATLSGKVDPVSGQPDNPEY